MSLRTLVAAAVWLLPGLSSHPVAAQDVFSPAAGEMHPIYRASPYLPPPSPFAPYTPGEEARLHDGATYRTLCVRLCDGYYFPISHATGSDGFTRDAERCAASCGRDARLFYHLNPGGDVASMLDLTGRTYASYPVAFKHRQTRVQGCQCRPEPWTRSEHERHRGYAVAKAGGGGPLQAETHDMNPLPATAAAVAARRGMNQAEAEAFLAQVSALPPRPYRLQVQADFPSGIWDRPAGGWPAEVGRRSPYMAPDPD
jgi:hypothetical protein